MVDESFDAAHYASALAELVGSDFVPSDFQVDSTAASGSAQTITVTITAAQSSKAAEAKQALEEQTANEVGTALGLVNVSSVGTPSISVQLVPAASPPALPPHKHVKVVILAEGNVVDYTPTKTDDLKERFAAESSVDVSAVRIMVVSASVKITITITTSSESSASELRDRLAVKLADPLLASNFTGITVTETPDVSTTADAIEEPAPPALSPHSPPPSVAPKQPVAEDEDGVNDDDDDKAFPPGAIVAIVLVGLLLLCPICCCCYAQLRYGSKRRNAWLRYRFNHSDPRMPYLYMPHEDRAILREELFGKPGGASVTLAKGEETDKAEDGKDPRIESRV